MLAIVGKRDEVCFQPNAVDGKYPIPVETPVVDHLVNGEHDPNAIGERECACVT